MNAMNRELALELRAAITAAMAEVAAKHGVKINVGSCTYDSLTARFKVEAVGSDASGQIVDVAAEAFKRNASLFGLKPEQLNSVFVFGGSSYRVTGLKPERPKFPVCASRVSDGKPFKFPVHAIRPTASI